ncbi:MAG: pyridoxamine 5'-phosphate oxidase family protein [Acidimicrobiia bacterium]|nr:pyridoxamine 5'-phosphate oxidase family protein [Acidimicrobiia bacterium]
MTDRKRTEVRRLPERGDYDPDLINSILDEALICHVGFVTEQGYPVVIPTIHARSGSTLYLHGSPASRMLRAVKQGADVCVTVTLVDGLVLARAVFHHSMNYRSVVIFGNPREVTDPDEKMRALEVITDHVAHGRWADARHPNDVEFKGTTVLAIEVDEASAKTRSGPPGDDDEDYELPIWAGVVPVATTFGSRIDDPALAGGIDPPGYVTDYHR